MPSTTVVVVGAGAGGMMAAGRAAECGAGVRLLEKTDGPGKKVLISGRTRCNVTNARSLDEFIDMYGKNGRFLYPAFGRFFRDELLDFLGRYGVTTTTESDGRIFPASGMAQDVVGALTKYLDDTGVSPLVRTRVTGIKVAGGRIKGVEIPGSVFPAPCVILATGGAGYPGTGSSGDGYRMAAALGHTIVPIRPALVPLTVKEVGWVNSMQGLSLRDVRLTAYQRPADDIDPAIPVRDCGRGTGVIPRPPLVESRTGDIIFTHFGLSGPAALKMSLAVYDALQQGSVSIAVDLRPALTLLQLRQEIQDYLNRHGKRTYQHILTGLLPEKMAALFLNLTRIPPDKPASQISALERDRLTAAIKSLRFNVSGTLPLAAAMVTAGGVALDEIDPRTMQSKLVKGLFFCGEVMDIDADTGGFNLQAAFSTGFVAGESAAKADLG